MMRTPKPRGEARLDVPPTLPPPALSDTAQYQTLPSVPPGRFDRTALRADTDYGRAIRVAFPDIEEEIRLEIDLSEQVTEKIPVYRSSGPVAETQDLSPLTADLETPDILSSRPDILNPFAAGVRMGGSLLVQTRDDR